LIQVLLSSRNDRESRAAIWAGRPIHVRASLIPVDIPLTRAQYKNKPETGNSDGAPILGPGDFVKMECAACGHEALIPSSAVLQGLRLPPTAPCARFGTATFEAAGLIRRQKRHQIERETVHQCRPDRDLFGANGIRRDNITQAGTFAFEVASGV